MKKELAVAWFFASLVGGLAQTYPNDAIFVAEEQKLRVSAVDSNGVVKPIANNIGLLYGLASDQGGTLYAAGGDDSTVRKIRLLDGFISTFVSVDSPGCMTLDTNGNLYIADDAHGMVYRASPSGQLDMVASYLDWPTGMAFATNGDLYVADLGSGTVDRIMSDGSVAVSIGFSRPWGLSSDKIGNLYVAESSADIISKIAPDGIVSTFATGLSYPTGVAVDSAGYVYVCNIGDSSLRKISPQGLMVTYATGLDYPTDMAIQRRNRGDSAPTAVPNVSNAFIFPAALQSLIRSHYTGPMYYSIATSSNNAQVTLDGSGSFVPDQQPLTYVWGDYDSNHFTAYSAPSSSPFFSDDISFENGAMEKILSLRVYKGSEFDEALFDVYVANVPQTIGLLGRINEFFPSPSVSPRLSRNLTTSLQLALAAASRHSHKAAITRLQDYQNAILALGPSISPNVASGFELLAQNLIDALDGQGAVANQPPPVLNISIEGRGKVVPNITNSILQWGTTYTLLAKPQGKYVFAGWSGDLVSNSNRLTFVATTNLMLQANFVPKSQP